MTIEQKRWDDAAPTPIKYLDSKGNLLDVEPTEASTGSIVNRALAKRWEDAPAQPIKFITAKGELIDYMPREASTGDIVDKALAAQWAAAPAQVAKFVNRDGTVADCLPSASLKLYAWKDESDNIAYTKVSTPGAGSVCYLPAVTGLTEGTIKEVATGKITITISDVDVDFSAYSTGDITL